MHPSPDARPALRTQASAFAPASVGNIGVGFDLLGHTFDGPRDIATVRRIDAPEVRVLAIEGPDPAYARIPLQPERNTAGRALLALREALALDHGFELTLRKNIPLGSGMGGSAASCVASLVAANALLPTALSREALYPIALQGESVSTGGLTGDNVGPMLVGGIAIATPSRLLSLRAPEGLHCAVVRPHTVLETRSSRAALTAPYALGEFVRQSAHLALFLSGLARGDTALIAEGLRDVLVEPRRASSIPGFTQVKAAALDHGALGASISGAGPSVFGWFDSMANAQAAAMAMRQAFAQAGLDSDAHVSPVNGPRADVID